MPVDAIALAHEVIAKYGADTDKPSVHLARALLALHDEAERMRPVYEAACEWGKTEATDLTFKPFADDHMRSIDRLKRNLAACIAEEEG